MIERRGRRDSTTSFVVAVNVFSLQHREFSKCLRSIPNQRLCNISEQCYYVHYRLLRVPWTTKTLSRLLLRFVSFLQGTLLSSALLLLGFGGWRIGLSNLIGRRRIPRRRRIVLTPKLFPFPYEIERVREDSPDPIRLITNVRVFAEVREEPPVRGDGAAGHHLVHLPRQLATSRPRLFRRLDVISGGRSGRATSASPLGLFVLCGTIGGVSGVELGQEVLASHSLLNVGLDDEVFGAGLSAASTAASDSACRYGRGGHGVSSRAILS